MYAVMVAWNSLSCDFPSLNRLTTSDKEANHCLSVIITFLFNYCILLLMP